MYTPISKHLKFLSKTKKERYVFLYGGKRSGKTYSVLFWLLLNAIKKPNLKIQLIAPSYPILKDGILSDFQSILKLSDFKIYNSTEKVFSLKNGSRLIFTSVDSIEKANSLGAADYRYFNELPYFDKEVFDLLVISTRYQIFADFNPVKEFFVDEYATKANIKKFTYRDNENLTKEQVLNFKNWETRGKNSKIGTPDYYRWQVFCLGNYCNIFGNIFTPENINIIDEMPSNEKILKTLIFIEPSKMHGYDYFAMIEVSKSNIGNYYVTDCFSENDKPFSSVIKWLKEKPNLIKYIETNGIGKDVYMKLIRNNIQKMQPVSSKMNKFDKIISNYDIITDNVFFISNKSSKLFCEQIYTFSDKSMRKGIISDKDYHDDNIDCVASSLLQFNYF